MSRKPDVWFEWDYSLILEWRDDALFREEALPPIETILPGELNARILSWVDAMDSAFGDAHLDEWVPASADIEAELEREYLEIRERMRALGLKLSRKQSRWPFGHRRSFSRTWGQRAARTASVLVVVIVVGAASLLSAQAAVEEFAPCSSTRMRATEQFAATLREDLGATGVEIFTYDCDSGSSPLIVFETDDPAALSAGLREKEDCREGKDVDGPVLACPVAGFTIWVGDGEARILS